MPSPVRLRGLRHRLLRPSTLALVGLNLLLYFLLFRWAGENIQASRLAEYFRQIPVWAILGSLLINFLALALYGVRMGLLLRRDFHTAFSIINIGYALNTLIPLRMGEGIKLFLSHKMFAVPLTGIFAASVAEKMIDLVKILVLGSAIVLFAAGEAIQVSAMLSIFAIVLLAAGVVVLFRRNVVRIVKLFPRGSRLRRASIDLHKHANEYPVVRIVAATAGIGILNIALVYFTFNTYLPGLRIGIVEAIALLVVVALAIAIPSAPAGLGLFEAAIVAFLTQKSNVGNEAALAAASVFHLVITLPQLVMTAWLMWGRDRILSKAKIDDRRTDPL